MICIYKITSPTERVYVGKTTSFERRMKEYKRLSTNTKGQPRLYYSLKKYGLDNHNISILESFPSTILKEELNERECFWIEFEKSYFHNNSLGMNLTKGGDGGNGVKFNHSQKTKDNLRLKHSKGVIYCFIDQKYEGSFNSVEEATRFYKLNSTNIWRSIKSKSLVMNKYAFAFNIDLGLEEYKSFKNLRPVLQLDLKNKTVNRFSSAIEAAKSLNKSFGGNITRCCLKTRATAYGFKWKYEDDINLD